MTGDEFQTLMLPLGDKLFRFSCAMMQNPNDAEDALQEVFIKLWKNRAQLACCDNIEAYAVRVMKNHCLDKLKAKRLSLVQTDLNTLADYQRPHTLGKLEINEQHKEILQIINALPEQQRIILTLRDMDGYSFEEIERIMDLNITTIRTNLCRARQFVRKKLTDQSHDK